MGNLGNLKAAVEPNGSHTHTGVGHTRWATHGKVSEENAHPLEGCNPGEVSIALNGIVENFRELKESLEAEGHDFSSETDAEVVTHLIERHYGGDLLDAVRVVYKQLEGHFAFVVIHKEHPDLLVGARLQCPLVVGVGDGEMFLASSIAAFQRETSRVKLIEDGEVVEITPAGARFVSTDDEERDRDELIIEWDDESAERQGYETFMLKEIYEQPYAVERTLEEYIVDGEVKVDARAVGRGAGRHRARAHPRLRHRVPRGRRRAGTRSRSGRASRASSTSRASGSTATRSSRRARS